MKCADLFIDKQYKKNEYKWIVLYRKNRNNEDDN